MMKVAYTGWTWITSHEPEAAKAPVGTVVP